MCGGSITGPFKKTPAQHAKEQQAKRQKQDKKYQENLAAANQAELDRIAAQQQAVIFAQQQEQQQLTTRFEAQRAEQARTVQQLQQQRDEARLREDARFTAESAQLQAQHDLRLGSIQASGNAVTQSLRVLNSQGGQQGPTAAVSRRPTQKRGASTATSSLRMGATASGRGAGANLAI